jgi:hypothetical protein
VLCGQNYLLPKVLCGEIYCRDANSICMANDEASNPTTLPSRSMFKEETAVVLNHNFE